MPSVATLHEEKNQILSLQRSVPGTEHPSTAPKIPSPRTMRKHSQLHFSNKSALFTAKHLSRYFPRKHERQIQHFWYHTPGNMIKYTGVQALGGALRSSPNLLFFPPLKSKAKFRFSAEATAFLLAERHSPAQRSAVMSQIKKKSKIMNSTPPRGQPSMGVTGGTSSWARGRLPGHPYGPAASSIYKNVLLRLFF